MRRRDYVGVVDDWHDRRAALLAERFAAVDGVGGILVWGDPSLYDSTLRVVDRVRTQISFDVEVIPGITSVQALAARHRIVLNRVGEPVVLTTGRRLREAELSGDAVVMLDAGTAFEDLDPDDADLVGRLPGDAGRDAGRGDGRGGRREDPRDPRGAA